MGLTLSSIRNNINSFLIIFGTLSIISFLIGLGVIGTLFSHQYTKGIIKDIHSFSGEERSKHGLRFSYIKYIITVEFRNTEGKDGIFSYTDKGKTYGNDKNTSYAPVKIGDTIEIIYDPDGYDKSYYNGQKELDKNLNHSIQELCNKLGNDKCIHPELNEPILTYERAYELGNFWFDIYLICIFPIFTGFFLIIKFLKPSNH